MDIVVVPLLESRIRLDSL